jgi:hypothetical protein
MRMDLLSLCFISALITRYWICFAVPALVVLLPAASLPIAVNVYVVLLGTLLAGVNVPVHVLPLVGALPTTVPVCLMPFRV